MTKTIKRSYYRQAMDAWLHNNPAESLKSVATSISCNYSALNNLRNGQILNIETSKHADGLRGALAIMGIEERRVLKKKAKKLGVIRTKTKHPGYVKMNDQPIDWGILKEAHDKMEAEIEPRLKATYDQLPVKDWSITRKSLSEAFLTAAKEILTTEQFTSVLMKAWEYR